MALPLRLDDTQTFATFIAGDSNRWCVDTLLAIHPHQFSLTYLNGDANTGKTHLLHALATQLTEAHASTCYYIPCRQYSTAPPAIALMTDCSALLLDDISAIGGDISPNTWEYALLDIYARCEQTHTPLVVSDRLPANELPLLADVTSRLSSSTQLHLTTLDDKALVNVIKTLFQRRGITINSQAVQFLLHHAPRNIGTLRRICFTVETLLGQGGTHRGISTSLLKQAIDAP